MLSVHISSVRVSRPFLLLRTLVVLVSRNTHFQHLNAQRCSQTLRYSLQILSRLASTCCFLWRNHGFTWTLSFLWPFVRRVLGEIVPSVVVFIACMVEVVVVAKRVLTPWLPGRSGTNLDSFNLCLQIFITNWIDFLLWNSIATARLLLKVLSMRV